MDFTGKICPYCKGEFKEDDEIVLCSICEMPHHKECWVENQGCTTFGCTGTIMGVDNYSGESVCKKCGTAYIDGQRFCSYCGGNLLDNGLTDSSQFGYSYEQQQTSSNTTQQNSFNINYGSQNKVDEKEDMRKFIDKKQIYYIDKFEHIDYFNEKLTWNWASAFFGMYWYPYRKMYKIAIIYYISSFIFGIIPGFSGISRIVFFIVSGMFGNYLYKRHVEKHLEVVKHMESYMKQSYLLEKGGTSSGAVWVTIGITVILAIIVNGITKL
ncbi:RING finger protein [Clostridium saccharoperbutylacetonicum]